LQEAEQLLLPQHSVEVFEYLSQLEWVSLSIILWKREWVIRVTRSQELLVLIKPIEKDDVLANLILGVITLDGVGELNELFAEHVLQELLESLVLLIGCARLILRA